MVNPEMHALSPIELLNYASAKLADICHEVVFLGGAVVSLLVTETGGLPPEQQRMLTSQSN